METTAHYTIAKAMAVFIPTWGKVYVAGVLSVMFFFFSEMYTEGLVAILMLMIIDTVLGVISAKKNNHEITSKRFMNAVYKGMIYFTAIASGHFADATIPFHIIESSMIAFVGVTEFTSVIENMGKMGYKTPKKLLNQLAGKYE